MSNAVHCCCWRCPFISQVEYCPIANRLYCRIHLKKRFTSFPSPAGMSLTKLPLGRNNSVMTSLFPPRESLVVTSAAGDGKLTNLFLRCMNPDMYKWTLLEGVYWSHLFSLYTVCILAGIFKFLWSPEIDSRVSILPAYVAWRAGTTTLFLPGS